jgi:hypothetical protein
MEYRIKRGDEEFGPYNLADLQRYVLSGHVAATDVAQSEGMTDWVSVQQVLGDIPIPAMAGVGTLPGFAIEAEIPRELVPLPPNLHWGWVLAIDVLTRSYFNIVWALIQANWARKLSGKNTPMVLIAMYPMGMISGAVAMVIGQAGGVSASPIALFGTLLIVAGLICMLAGVFSIRNAMENYYNSVENIGLSMGGGMTFFFGVIYIQYHINRIARWKKTGALS